MSTTAQQHRWSDIPAEQLNPLLTRRFISGEQAMVARLHLKQGCIVPLHAHHNEQISTVLSGALLFTLGEPGHTEQKTLRPGDVLVIPAHVPHSAEALEDTDNLDIFAPPRQDWISGTDVYLRQTPTS